MAIKVRRGKLYPPVEYSYAASLGLDEIEWERIVDRLGRAPNHFECSVFAMLWSEEVSNKSSAALLATIARKQPEVVSIPGSELGVIDLGNDQYLALRIVHNNQQSAIEPFYGVQTAMDASLEELTSVGAVPLGILNLLRFGNFDLIRNQRLFQGTVEGVGSFSSKYGVPVIGGELYFHQRYNGGVIINSGVAGILRSKNALKQDPVSIKSPVLYVGAKTGKDGLIFKKDGEDENILESQKKQQATMKISDPLLSNRLINACAEAIEKGVLREIVAVGTGGLCVACFDLSHRIGKPILLDIDRVPLRSEDLDPLQIILSESSERVLMVTNRRQHRALNQILYKWDLESVKVGEVNDADGIEFYWNHYLAADIPFQFALGGSIQRSYEVVQFPPMLKRTARSDDANKLRKRKRKVVDEWSLVREVSLAKDQEDEDREIICPKDLEDVWLDMLANPNLCSRAPMYNLFDQVVGANTIQRPGGDSAVLRIRANKATLPEGEPKTVDELLDHVSQNGHSNGANGHAHAHAQDLLKESAIAVTLDSNSLYAMMEPYLGTVQTVAEGMRNLAAVGARPVGLAYCFNYGSPDRYLDICDLSESIRGLGDAARIWKIPILSKQIALNNGSEGNPIMPTPAVLMAGIIKERRLTCSTGFKHRGDIVLLLGQTLNEIGCSEYASYFHKFVNRLVPDIKFEEEKKTCDTIVHLIESGLLESAHDLSAGGLAVAITESCMTRGRPIGVTFTIDPQSFDSPHGPIPLRKDSALFSETSGRFLISCRPEREEEIRRICEEANIPITGRGKVGGKDMVVNGVVDIELPLSTTYKLWIHRLENLLGIGGHETVGF